MLPTDQWHLSTQRLGRVLVFDRVESTNSLAAGFASLPGNDGLVVLAKEQTAGRGQHGRTWQCPPDTGVLLSILLFPPPALRRPALLTAWAAVAVCQTIQKAARVPARIKWPNDVLIDGRKVCGILIESRNLGTEAAGEFHSVIGIGLNVQQPAAAFTGPGLGQATSLLLATGRHFDCPEIARLLIGQLDAEYHRLCEGDLATLEAAWQARIGLLGCQVVVECLDGSRGGTLRALAWQGLDLELEGGEMLRLPLEAVRHLTHVQSPSLLEGEG